MSAYNCFGSELSVPTIYITSVEKIYMGDKYTVLVFTYSVFSSLKLEANQIKQWIHGNMGVTV